MQHLAHFILLPFELLDIAQQEHVGVLHLQVKLDRLEQNSLQHHHLFLGIISKLGKLHIIQEAAGSFNDIFALLWGFLYFTSQEKTTSSRHISGKLLEGVKHVEAVEIYDARCQCVIV